MYLAFQHTFAPKYSKRRILSENCNVNIDFSHLTHSGLTAPCGDRDMGRHWPR